MADFESKLRWLSERGNPVGAEEMIERIEAEMAGDPLVVVAKRREGILITKTREGETGQTSRYRGPVWAVAMFVAILAAVGLYLPTNDGEQVAAPTTVPTPTTALTTAEPTIEGGMWPQSNLEEVQEAQERADALDNDYLWQTSPRGFQLGQNHPFHESFFTRFLVEVLGWEEFRWHEDFAHRDDLVSGDVLYVRCAPGETNPLYPDDPDGGCAPTIDEFRYETVKIHVAQLDSQGREVAEPNASGIFVVTGWEIVEPSVQIAPPTDAEIAAFIRPFLEARIAGERAEYFAVFDENDPHADDRTDQPIPLLYGASGGAPYERWEFEVVEGPVWPEGRMELEVRLFAENGETVVEQAFRLERDDTGRLQLVFDFQPTTENGQVVPEEYGFLDGEVTYRAAYPLEPSDDGYRDRDRLAIVGLLPDDGAPRRVLLMLADPRPIGPECVEASAPADAEALAQSIRSDPDFESSPPVAVTIGGTSALQIDVFLAPGASTCSWSEHGMSGEGPQLLSHAPFAAGGYAGSRARLFLLDLPAGSAARVLAMATITDEDSFETVLEWAAPIVNSIEFHAR